MLADGAPVHLSASQLEGARACPLQQFLRRRVRAEAAGSAAMGFGSVLHAVAEEVGEGHTPADEAAVMARVEQVWDDLGFEADWRRASELERAREAVGRFLRWHRGAAERGRTYAGAEVDFAVTLEVPAATGPQEVVVRGRADRLETDADGQVVVVDLKTGKTLPRKTDIERHAQLATYQAVVRAGGFPGAGDRPGGAELLQLRHDAGAGQAGAKTQTQGPRSDDGEVLALAADVVDALVEERVRATPGTACDRCEFRTSCPTQGEGRQVVA